jgi:hypothetical protein
MCSGCAGEYAGGFDDPGECAADGDGANSLTWNCGEPDQQRSQPPAEETRGFEPKVTSRGDRHAIARASSDESSSDVWEILVTGTHIVEIRIIAANGCELKELRGAGADAQPRACQQSASVSAKYYKTRWARAKNVGDLVQTVCCHWIGGVVAAELRKWLQLCAKRLGNITREEFRVSSKGFGRGDGIA